MKLKKYENFELNKDWQDASAEEIEKISIPAYKNTGDHKNILGEDDVDFIVAKIRKEFPIEKVSQKIESEDADSDTALIDMICWFENEYRDILDEDVVLDKLRKIYQLD
jgi:hypothetical protein